MRKQSQLKIKYSLALKYGKILSFRNLHRQYYLNLINLDQTNTVPSKYINLFLSLIQPEIISLKRLNQQKTHIPELLFSLIACTSWPQKKPPNLTRYNTIYLLNKTKYTNQNKLEISHLLKDIGLSNNNDKVLPILN